MYAILRESVDLYICPWSVYSYFCYAVDLADLTVNISFALLFRFPNVGIQCCKRHDVEESLKVRERIRVDPFGSVYFGDFANGRSLDVEQYFNNNFFLICSF